MTTRAVQELVKRCQQLTSLDISHCTLVTSAAVYSLQDLPELIDLSLTGTSISDRVVEIIGRPAGGRRRLCLRRTPLTSVILPGISSDSVSLTHLDLSLCAISQAALLHFFSFLVFPNLFRLEISRSHFGASENIPIDLFIQTLLTSCPSLTYLGILCLLN